jgi:hypothetical protein
LKVIEHVVEIAKLFFTFIRAHLITLPLCFFSIDPFGL